MVKRSSLQKPQTTQDAKKLRSESPAGLQETDASAWNYRAAVHELLSPRPLHTEAAAPLQAECGAVCVMGMPNSGAHAFVEYVNTYFDVVVYPPMKRKIEGLLAFID